MYLKALKEAGKEIYSNSLNLHIYKDLNRFIKETISSKSFKNWFEMLNFEPANKQQPQLLRLLSFEKSLLLYLK